MNVPQTCSLAIGVEHQQKSVYAVRVVIFLGDPLVLGTFQDEIIQTFTFVRGSIVIAIVVTIIILFSVIIRHPVVQFVIVPQAFELELSLVITDRFLQRVFDSRRDENVVGGCPANLVSVPRDTQVVGTERVLEDDT